MDKLITFIERHGKQSTPKMENRLRTGVLAAFEEVKTKCTEVRVDVVCDRVIIRAHSDEISQEDFSKIFRKHTTPAYKVIDSDDRIRLFVVAGTSELWNANNPLYIETSMMLLHQRLPINNGWKRAHDKWSDYDEHYRNEMKRKYG